MQRGRILSRDAGVTILSGKKWDRECSVEKFSGMSEATTALAKFALMPPNRQYRNVACIDRKSSSHFPQMSRYSRLPETDPLPPRDCCENVRLS